ncbi:MAG: hypothetical protein K2O95_00740 [Clostridia bacterium]|nr:hypothetical protein [Clostridia bacterium]
MKRKALSVILTLLIVVVTVMGMAGCKDPAPQTEYCVVTVIDCGIETSLTVEKGATVTLEDKQRNGYEFLGYYKENEKVDSSFTVTEDVTLVTRYQYGDLAENLVNALRTYLNSQTFENTVASARTAAAWLPLSYLRYVEGDFYTNTNAVTFKKYINMINELVVDGEIKDVKWPDSEACQQGWYGITDYLYTYSIAINAYKEYLHGKGLTDNSADVYLEAIKKYLEKVDTWLGNSNVVYDILGDQVTQSNLYYEGYNKWNRFTYSSYFNSTKGQYAMGQERTRRLLECVAQATGTDEGHEEFLSEYAKLEEMHLAIQAEAARIKPEVDRLTARYNELTTQYNELSKQIREMEDGDEKNQLIEQRAAVSQERSSVISERTSVQATKTQMENDFSNYGMKANFMAKFKGFMPVTQVAFGMSATAYIAIVKANLSLDANTPYTDNVFISRYEKDDDGNFVKEGGTPNWVGPTGAPVAASLYRDREEYDVNFEKCKQGYFPFSDGWSQPLDEMVNLDRLGKYYNHTLETNASVVPQWGLLTGYMHGIDMENYEVAEPVEGEPTVYNVISLWRDNLNVDDDGNYVIKGNLDMAVAIAYLAYINGIDAPSPLGAFNSADKVISIL